MSELQKLYEMWSDEQSDNKEVKKLWCQIMKTLYQNCSEQDSERTAASIMEYSRQIEANAFMAGYGSAFHLWMDILNIHEIIE